MSYSFNPYEKKILDTLEYAFIQSYAANISTTTLGWTREGWCGERRRGGLPPLLAGWGHLHVLVHLRAPHQTCLVRDHVNRKKWLASKQQFLWWFFFWGGEGDKPPSVTINLWELFFWPNIFVLPITFCKAGTSFGNLLFTRHFFTIDVILK